MPRKSSSDKSTVHFYILVTLEYRLQDQADGSIHKKLYLSHFWLLVLVAFKLGHIAV